MRLFGFGTVVSDTVWDFVQYAVGYPLARTLEAAAYVQALPDDAFKGNAEQRKKALAQKLDAATDKIEEGEYQDAIDKLEDDVRAKMDGNSKDDWITDSAAQGHLCGIIDDACRYLRTL